MVDECIEKQSQSLLVSSCHLFTSTAPREIIDQPTGRYREPYIKYMEQIQGCMQNLGPEGAKGNFSKFGGVNGMRVADQVVSIHMTLPQNSTSN